MLHATLCGMKKEHYHLMILALLESSVKEAWVKYTAVKPDAATWESIDRYTDTILATKDKSAGAEQHFQKALFRKETTAEWQAYTATQSKAIADMAGPKRRFTDACL